MMFVIKVIDEGVFIRCLCVILPQGIFDKLICVRLDRATGRGKSVRSVQEVQIAKPDTGRSDQRGLVKRLGEQMDLLLEAVNRLT